MVSHTPAIATPVDWIELHASQTPDAPALAFIDGEVSYAQLADLVKGRQNALGSLPATVVPVVVRHDLASIVEVLSVMVAGGCVMPVLEPVPIPEALPRDADVLAIRTSGSSGEPRIVPLTMMNLAASAAASRRRLGTGAQDRWLACLPLDHIGGLSVLLRSFEAGGCAVVVPFDRSTAESIRVLQPTVASMVPTMVYRLLAEAVDTLASMRWILTGGASMRQSMAETARSRGVSLIPTFGMTEASSQIACLAVDEVSSHAGFVGKPLDSVVVAAPGGTAKTPALIQVDGPTVFDGYLGESPRSGPFVTSDLGWLDDDGRLTVVGRADGVVIAGGVNVSLVQIEDVLRDLDGVDDAAVVAVENEEWGVEICAMVVTNRSEPEVAEAASATLDRAWLPKRWSIVDRLPLLSNGKPDNGAIRRTFDH